MGLLQNIDRIDSPVGHHDDIRFSRQSSKVCVKSGVSHGRFCIFPFLLRISRWPSFAPAFWSHPEGIGRGKEVDVLVSELINDISGSCKTDGVGASMNSKVRVGEFILLEHRHRGNTNGEVRMGVFLTSLFNAAEMAAKVDPRRHGPCPHRQFSQPSKATSGFVSSSRWTDFQWDFPVPYLDSPLR